MKPLVEEGNILERFFLMLVDAPTEKLHVTDRNEKGRTGELAPLRQGHFCFSH